MLYRERKELKRRLQQYRHSRMRSPIRPGLRATKRAETPSAPPRSRGPLRWPSTEPRWVGAQQMERTKLPAGLAARLRRLPRPCRGLAPRQWLTPTAPQEVSRAGLQAEEAAAAAPPLLPSREARATMKKKRKRTMRTRAASLTWSWPRPCWWQPPSPRPRTQSSGLGPRAASSSRGGQKARREAAEGHGAVPIKGTGRCCSSELRR